MNLGRFDESSITIERVKQIDKNPMLRTQNIIVSRLAELNRKYAAALPNREFEKKFKYLSDAISHFRELSDPDFKSGLALVMVLLDLSYLFFLPSAMLLLAETLEKYQDLIISVNSNKKGNLRSNVLKHGLEIDSVVFSRIKKVVGNFKIVSEGISKENEGIVIAIKEDYYGFISNATYKKKNAIHFLLSNAYDEIKIGDYVAFEIISTDKGKAAKNVRAIEESEIGVY